MRNPTNQSSGPTTGPSYTTVMTSCRRVTLELRVNDCSEDIHTIQLKEGGHWYRIDYISQVHSIVINETLPRSNLNPHNCESIKSFSLPSSSPSLSFNFTGNHLTLYNCSHSTGGITPPRDFNKTVCEGFDIYYHLQNSGFPSERQCSIIKLPLPEDQDPKNDNIPLLTTRVIVEVFVPPYCNNCQRDEGECRTNGKHLLDCPNARKVDWGEKVENIQLKGGGYWYEIDYITSADSIFINDLELMAHSNLCEYMDSFALPGDLLRYLMFPC
ncbi:hypothetical protein TorRG33x02_171970 [Trema orientale]|uniref:Uncharacterized protein n=1 Tax=Trema orientale TaxID=63057 RepID=A0A2P5EN19_TREOI|nr:hypothetical protein TorRG33x02_171970 [Trema orientale]